MPEESRRIGTISIIVYKPDEAYQSLNNVLHTYGHLILGRLGLPYREKQLSIISLIVDGNTDEIGAMTGKIGQIDGVTVKSSFAKLKDDTR